MQHLEPLWDDPHQRGNVASAAFGLDELAKSPDKSPLKWTLREIRAAGDRVRCAFADIQSHGTWWVYAFPKTKGQNRAEVDRAIRETEKLVTSLIKEDEDVKHAQR